MGGLAYVPDHFGLVWCGVHGPDCCVLVLTTTSGSLCGCAVVVHDALVGLLVLVHLEEDVVLPLVEVRHLRPARRIDHRRSDGGHVRHGVGEGGKRAGSGRRGDRSTKKNSVRLAREEADTAGGVWSTKHTQSNESTA